MDIFEYIDRVKANFDKQPEPRYNTKKYFMGGSVTTPKRGLVDEPGSYAGKDRLENITTPRKNLKALAEIIQQADIDDELEYLMSTPEEQLNQAKKLGRKKIVRHHKCRCKA